MNLYINNNKRYGLVGSNGAGKTTFLKFKIKKKSWFLVRLIYHTTIVLSFILCYIIKFQLMMNNKFFLLHHDYRTHQYLIITSPAPSYLTLTVFFLISLIPFTTCL
ncbi:ATP-binding cassette domain-containing protein [Rickettsia canadensis]|uniref:ATP-binding cassette domain-containing protein n=1 Tax=Rickettsia canadensis TaxID=788 RepID=UPI001E287D50|nr:ATP-binding cassette domain-containing protein [Rickettsia canadensis]